MKSTVPISNFDRTKALSQNGDRPGCVRLFAEELRIGRAVHPLEQALAGKTYVTPLVTKGVPLGVFLRRATSLPRRSLPPASAKVLQLLAEGRAMKEIADLLQVSARTVAFHKYTIMEHLGVKTSAELVQYALEHGMLKKYT